MDAKFEVLAAKGKNVVVLLGSVEESEFEMLALDSVSVTELQARKADLRFIGLLALLDGKIRAVFDAPIGAYAVRALAREYSVYLQRVTKCDA